MNKTTLAIGQWLFYVFDVYGIENRVLIHMLIYIKIDP